MEHSELFYVILSRPEEFDLQILSDLITPVLSLPRADITLRLKNSWGLLHSTATLQEAENLKEYLTQEGLNTFILPEKELTELPVPIILKKALPRDSGLFYEKENRETILPWDKVTLLGAS